MDEFSERSNEIPVMREFANQPEVSDVQYSLETLIDEVNDFIAEANDFINGLTSDAKETADDAREYGLRECSDAAKEIFTPEVLAEWNFLTYEQRERIVREYSKAIGEGLNIDFKGVIFDALEPELRGYNCGDGYVHLNSDFISDPKNLIGMIDTVAHEARHQFQNEAIRNPEKFGIDEATLKEWEFGFNNYSTQLATAYDPWGYHYNPVEIDARYFGETMVRELTKDLITNHS
jgi:hypothetical protein